VLSRNFGINADISKLQHYSLGLFNPTWDSTFFVPNMLKKDKALSRYPEFANYQANSELLLSKLFGNKSEVANNSAVTPESIQES
jgi:hypothetical protein